MSYVRTLEHRALRAIPIRKWKPREKSTGPTTPAGKSKASRNAHKVACGKEMRKLRQASRELDPALDAIKI